MRPRGGAPAAAAIAPELPPGLAPRLLAALVLADVVGAGRAQDDAFAAARTNQRFSGLDERDVSLARSIVVVSLRRLGTLRQSVVRWLERGWPRKSGPLEWSLIVAATQLLFLDVPDHAAVNACVQAVRLDPASQPFAALANAVARNIARERDAGGEAVSDPFLDTPAWLAARWRKTYGDAVARAVVEAHRREAPLDLSVKADPEVWAERLGGDLLATGSVRLRDHRPIPDLPGFAEGAWWVQDAAASLPARLLRAEAGERVADLCAAPGGKSAQLCLSGAQVVAVDRSAERLKRFALNLERLGLSAETVVADVAGFAAASFDAILLDAPCSATGTLRRHPDVAWTKRASDIPSLAAVQAKMLDRAAALLRPGGRLVYCVCSIEPEEGEAQTLALLRRNPDLSRSPVDATEIGGLTESLTPAGELRTLPCHRARIEPPIDGLDGLDGFYAVRLVRRA